MALHLLAVGTIAKGHTSLRVAPHNEASATELDAYLEQSVEDGAQGAPLQRLIDEAEQTEEYEWDIEDRNIWRRGAW